MIHQFIDSLILFIDLLIIHQKPRYLAGSVRLASGGTNCRNIAMTSTGLQNGSL